MARDGPLGSSPISPARLGPILSVSMAFRAKSCRTDGAGPALWTFHSVGPARWPDVETVLVQPMGGLGEGGAEGGMLVAVDEAHESGSAHAPMVRHPWQWRPELLHDRSMVGPGRHGPRKVGGKGWSPRHHPNGMQWQAKSIGERDGRWRRLPIGERVEVRKNQGLYCIYRSWY